MNNPSQITENREANETSGFFRPAILDVKERVELRVRGGLIVEGGSFLAGAKYMANEENGHAETDWIRAKEFQWNYRDG